MTELRLDFETHSTVDLRKAGVYVYAECPDTDVWCAAYTVDDGPVQLWVPREDVPSAVTDAVRHGWTIHAFNAAFERTIWNHIVAPRYGWPIPKLEQWRCTMVQALAMSLPASLKNACAAVGLDLGGKAEEGHRLMLQMSQPRRPRKNEDASVLRWWDDDERKQRLYAICKKDVADERELGRRLLELRPDELRLWQLDQVVNDRGCYVDIDLCRQATKVVDQATNWLNSEMQRLTEGAVSAITNVAQIAKWCRLQGFQTESLGKEVVEDMLSRGDVPDLVRSVLKLRLEGAKAAVKKIDALVAGRSKDGRAKGLSQFHAAGTGRSAGRRFQPKNIKRPDLDDVDGAIEAVSTGHAEYVRVVYGEPLAVVTDCLRGMVKAPPGRRIRAADFSNIEGRIQAWLAGEEWKLDAFRAFDAGQGPDIYKLAVSGLFSIPVEKVTKEQRQKIGKVQELAAGYEGGVAAYLRFGIAEAFPILVPHIERDAAGDEWDEAWERYTTKMAYGLAQREWTAVRIVVDRWRNRHPNIRKCWRDLEDAAISAVRNRGKVYTVGRAAFRVAGSFLFMRLPNGRCIVYPYPRLQEKLTPWGKMKLQVCYKGVDTYTKKWTDQFAHGGLLFNNYVQGTARDIEAEAMLRLIDRGYETLDPARHGIILEVYDEVVCETPTDFGSTEEFQEIMTALPAWAAGLPVAAEAWEAARYKKG